MATTKNSMPSFAQGSYNNILRLIADEKVNAPAFIYFTDKECLGFLDAKKDLHVILFDKVESILTQLAGLNDPTTGEPIKVTEYVTESIAPVNEKVETVTEVVQNIQKNGAVIMITSDGGDE